MSNSLVYAFDHEHPEPPMALKDLLGGKGANLAEMTSVLGLPVPPGFTITTEACRDRKSAAPPWQEAGPRAWRRRWPTTSLASSSTWAVTSASARTRCS